MKRMYARLLFICIFLSLLSGCGRAKPTAADSVKAIYDLYIVGDTTGAASLGLTEEDITAAQSTYDAALADTIRSNFSASGLEIDEEIIVSICQARREALSKMNASFTVVSEEGNKAVVTLSTTYFDELALDEDAAYGAREEADAKGFEDYDAYMNFIMERYTQNLIEGYKNVTPSKETKDVTISCIIVNNVWLPENMAAFGSELGMAVAGQN